jgi:hypothetical protein
LIHRPGREALRALAVVAAVCAVLVGSLFLSPAASRSAGGTGEGLPVGGVAHITVFNAQGQEVTTWTGHNTLFPSAAAAVAGCLGGQGFSATTTSVDVGTSTTAIAANLQGCSGFTPDILVAWGVGSGAVCPASNSLAAAGSNSCAIMSASNYLVPSGCTVNTCTGWDATATFPSTAFSASNGCATSCNIEFVLALQGTVWSGAISQAGLAGGNAFDLLTPGITLAQGDSLQITIAYTVT